MQMKITATDHWRFGRKANKQTPAQCALSDIRETIVITDSSVKFYVLKTSSAVQL